MANGTGLTGATNASIGLRYLNVRDLDSSLDELNINFGIQWTYGIGINQCNLLYHDTVTIVNAGNTTIDVFAGASTKDAFGNLVTMSAIKFLFIRNKSSDAQLNVGGGMSLDLLILAATSDIIVIPAGGFLMWCGPTAAGIVTSTNKSLYLVHNGAGSSSMDVDIVVMGID